MLVHRVIQLILVGAATLGTGWQTPLYAQADLGDADSESVSNVGEVVAMVVSAQGPATASGARGERPVAAGTPLYQGDRVATGRTSRVKILFMDESVISLAGNTDLTINEYSFGEGKTPKVVTTIENGSFRFLAGKIAKQAPENFIITTETATIGIRGSGGEGITSDGTQGSTAGLQVMTIPGHVLEVRTIGGELHVVDDPAVGLTVDGSGQGRILQIEGSLFDGNGVARTQPVGEPAEVPEEQPVQNTEAPWVPLALYREGVVRIAHPERKRRLSVDENDESDVIQGLFDHHVTSRSTMSNEIRDELANEPEGSSSRPMMERVGREVKADAFTRNKMASAVEEKHEDPKALKGRDIRCCDHESADAREGHTARDVLKRLGTEQKREIDATRKHRIHHEEF